ncbi:MAG: sigma-70 family RNA polymerase sigma factor [Planctomycetota bacterium]
MTDSESNAEQPEAGTNTGEFEPFRSYLHVLAETQMHNRLKSKVDASDIVQQTMLQAYQAKQQFRGSSDAEKAGWLRTILGNVLCGLARDFSRQRRDVAREQSIQAVEQSSLQLANLLSADGSSPSAAMHRHERAAELAQAMLKLTNEQRQAIILKYWHSSTLAEIGQHLEKTPEAVAGLIFRGMQKLKGEFQEDSEQEA